MTGTELTIVLIAVIVGAIVKAVTGMGLPIIASKECGVSNLDHVTTIPSGNTTALVDAIEKILSLDSV